MNPDQERQARSLRSSVPDPRSGQTSCIMFLAVYSLLLGRHANMGRCEKLQDRLCGPIFCFVEMTYRCPWLMSLIRLRSFKWDLALGFCLLLEEQKIKKSFSSSPCDLTCGILLPPWRGYHFVNVSACLVHTMSCGGLSVVSRFHASLIPFHRHRREERLKSAGLETRTLYVRWIWKCKWCRVAPATAPPRAPYVFNE